MSLYLGTSSNSCVQICKMLSEVQIRDLMQDLAHKIGEMKFCLNPDLNYHENIMEIAQVPSNFKGWAYCKGDLISKALFPKAYEVLANTSNYPGKQVTAFSVSLPSFSRFFRLNPGTTRSGIFQNQGQSYSTPTHIHKIGSTKASISDGGLIKDASFFWGTGVNTTSSGGCMPAQDINVNGKIYPIPKSPSGHYGSDASSSDYKVISWDIPVDAIWNNGNRIHFKANTGNASSSGVCQPKNVECAMMMFIGYP